MPQDDNASTIEDLKKEAKDDIFALLGAADIDPDEKAALLGQMLEVVQTRALTKIIDLINDEQKAELEKIAEDEDAEALDDFLAKVAPNYPQIFQDEVDKLRQELIIKFSK